MNQKDAPGRTTKQNYALCFEHRTLYADMDAFRHLNNGAIGRFFEEGRADLNIKIFGPEAMTNPPDGLQLLFASVHIDFIRQAHYPGVVEIATAVNRVGNSSWAVFQAGFQDGECFALTEAAMVKAVHGRPVSLTDREREIMQQLLFRQ
jgi:acyl-CoA thioester hydrolase